MINGIYNSLTPSGIYITISYGYPSIREHFFNNPAWNWKLQIEKVTKPTINTDPGAIKDEGVDQKNFHYIYILKKQPPPPEEKPVEKKQEEEKSDEKDDENQYEPN